MQSFGSVEQSVSVTNSETVFPHLYLRGDDDGTHIADLGELQQTAGNGFHHLDAVFLSKSSVSLYNGMKASNLSVMSSNWQLGGVSNSLCSGGTMGFGGGGATAGPLEDGNWADYGIQTEASTDTDYKNQSREAPDEGLIFVDPTDHQPKAQIRAQKAYVEQLESSQKKLVHLQQDLVREKPQGIIVRSEFSGDHSQSIGGKYIHWNDEHQRLINDLRSALNSHVGDNQLQLLVGAVMSNYDELFRIKTSGAKSDIFQILSGIWKTPAERLFMWLGGFRCSDVLKVLGNQMEPALSEQQLVGICNLQQSSQQAEDALSQGMEALQQSIVETLSYNYSYTPHNVDDYVGRMTVALTKIATVENFLHQADLLRLQMLQQLQRILTTRQAARALLAINDYKTRLRALSLLWQARPKG